MSGKIWKKLLAAGCAMSLLATAPGMTVLADQISEDEVIVTDAEDPEELVEPFEEVQEDVIDEISGIASNKDKRRETYESVDSVDMTQVANEEVVGEGNLVVGDGVTATFDEETGSLEFYSDGGTLWEDWLDRSGLECSAIESIKVSAGKVYLPKESSEIFAVSYYDDDEWEFISNLKEIDLSGFDTSKVESMDSMFFNCKNLTNLDLSGFDTSNVTSMWSMFDGCRNIMNLDLNSFDTSNVTNMYCMFNDCSSLTELNLSSFDTSNVTNMGNMFFCCSSLTDLDLSGFDTSNVTNMNCMFYSCESQTSLDLNSFDTSNVEDMGNMFAQCTSLTNLDLSSFDTSNVESMGSMFATCTSLTNLDLSSFDTSNVSTMNYMFNNCSSLTNLDLSCFDTSNVTEMEYMFGFCDSLINLDISGFDMTSVESYDCFIDCCYALKNLKTPKKSSISIELPYLMIDESGNQYKELPALSHSITITKKTVFENIPVGENVTASFDENTGLVEFFSTDGTLWKDWLNQSGFDIKTIQRMRVASGVVHLPEDSSSIFSVAYFDIDSWAYLSNLSELDLKGFDTSNVSNMSSMFNNCTSLTTLDLSEFITSKVTKMGGMFSGCGSLIHLDLGGFDTSNVTNMSYMFTGCKSLTNLDLSGFDTSKVENMCLMFKNCSSLKTVDLSSFNTSKVEWMNDWEEGGMFQYCSSLTSLDLSGFDTSRIKDMTAMFYGCSSLAELELGDFDTSKVEYMAHMFSDCNGLASINMNTFDTENVTRMDWMFAGCNSLASLDLSRFDTSCVEDMDGMFCDCNNLETLDLSSFDTSSVKYFGSMFFGCNKLTELNLSNFDTSNAFKIAHMFSGCSNLRILDISSFDISHIDSWYDWLYEDFLSECQELRLLKTPKANGLDIHLPVNMYDESGNEYTELPVMSESIILTREKPGLANDISDCSISLTTTSYTYDGKAKEPSVSVKNGDDILTAGTDYTVSYSDNTNAGTATAKVTGIGNYEGEQTVTFTIGKATPELAFASSSVNKTTLDAVFTNNLTITTDGTVTFNSSDIKVATVDSTSGKVTIKGEGTATITATAAEGTNYKSGSAEYTMTVVDGRTDVSGLTVSLSATSYTYDGKAKEPTVTVKNGSTVLTSGTDYTVSYADNINAGTATAKVAGAGKYKGEKSVTFTISKADAKLTFADSALTKKTTDAAFTNTLTKTTDESVTFKSSNTNVATVNSTSGLVTIKGAGTVTITATASEGKNYKAGSATYSLTVEAPVPTATPTPTPKPTATPTPKPTAAPASKPTVSGFSDVQDPNHAYYKAIYWAADAGITKGYPDGTFGIDKSCTRGEMMMFLWRYAGKPAAKAVSKSPFKDVAKNHAFYKAILWGSQKGITKGYPDGTFGINRNVSRGECMMFLWRLKGTPAPKAVTKSPFKDVAKNHAFYNAILWGSQNKVTTGYTSGAKKGTFGINENCTRGQIVTFLYRAK